MTVNRYLVGAYALAARRVELVGDEPEEAQVAKQIAREVDSAIQQQLTSTPNTEGGRTVDGGGAPGSYVAPQPSQPRALPSPVDGVTDEDWTRWVTAMRVAEPGAVSETSKLGLFAFKLQRLADLGLVRNLAPTNARKTGHMAWTGEWVAPLSQEIFLSNPALQYRVLAASARLHACALADGEIAWPDVEEDHLTLSGALALLHKCGPRGFEQWADEEKRQPTTIKLLEATNGIY